MHMDAIGHCFEQRIDQRVHQAAAALHAVWSSVRGTSQARISSLQIGNEAGNPGWMPASLEGVRVPRMGGRSGSYSAPLSTGESWIAL
jgi:hypothetical protein